MTKIISIGCRVKWTVGGHNHVGTVTKVVGAEGIINEAGTLIVRPDRPDYPGQTVPVIPTRATIL